MLIELIKGLWYVLFKAKVNKKSEGLMVLASWILATALLCVSIPHSIDVIFPYERGELASAKAVALAFVVEVITAFLLLIALHAKGLTRNHRLSLGGLALPFIL